MRVQVKSCVKSVMGEKPGICVPTTEKSSFSPSVELRMCPLTSSITTDSHVTHMGQCYPRRIILSFLRHRLAGKQEEISGNNRQLPQSDQNSHLTFSSSTTSTAMISKISKKFSGKNPCEEMDKIVSSTTSSSTITTTNLARDTCQCNRSSSKQNCRQTGQVAMQTEAGGISNHCVSGSVPNSSQEIKSTLSSEPCTCCLLQNISNCSSTSSSSLSSFVDSQSENKRKNLSTSNTEFRLVNKSTIIAGDNSYNNSNLSNAVQSSSPPSQSLCANAVRIGQENTNSNNKKLCHHINGSKLSFSSLVYRLVKDSNKTSRCGGGLMKVFLVLFILFLITDSSLACGPGRGAGRRRAPRKLTPLVYKQHVPNLSENTISASGFTEGRITRKDAKFKNLVPNYNQDIIFRDEEGTGADRLMTQRCKEKLNTLAISVMNQWPGVKLRVIEGWDEELHHATHSLHYEGRAVDITTSDKDRSKYGMLARLAVEAGFDWVYYESRAHIHLSVKSDSSQASRTGGCFSGNSTVETPSGPKKMQEVKPGDKILTIDEDGRQVFSDVLMFLDRNTTEVREFYELTTESGAKLTLTPSHLLYSVRPDIVAPEDEFLLLKNRYLKAEEVSKYFLDQAEITFAKYVQIGDWVLVKSHQDQENASFTPEKIIAIELRVETGVYAPLTLTGNLIVDGVLTSCYALIKDQGLAHVAFAPVRLVHNFRQSVTYLWRQFSRFISFSHALPQPSQDANVHAASSNSINNNQISSEEEFNKLDSKPPKFSSSSASPSSTWKPRSSSTNVDQLSEQGIHWYASFLYSTFRYILPASLLYD